MNWESRIGRRVKFRDVHIALAVAQSGSMLKAAEALAMSQPVVSKAIADLEHAVGVKLFDRNNRGVELTPSGQVLLNRGRAAFDELSRGVKEIEFLNDPSVGELRIGSIPHLAEGIVLMAIDRLSKAHPRITYHIESGGAFALREKLRERRVEIVFSRMTESEPNSDIDQEALCANPLVVVAGLESPWARRRKLALADLVDEPWTWPTAGSAFDTLVVAAFRARGLEPPRAMVYADDYSVRIRLAGTGRVLAVVPASVSRFTTTQTSIKELPVELPTTQRDIGVVTLKNRTLSPLAQRFIACVRDIVGPAPKRQGLRGTK